MTESTARAERFNPPTPSASFTWSVPQKPVSVRIPYPVIDRLEQEVVENFRSLSSRGSEIGGVLLGSVAAGSPLIVTLDDYELVVCDYSRGPLYRLSDADMGRFERAIEQKRARVVGYFRSHTRKGLTLDPEDLGFLQLKFRDPHQFALLIRPFASKASSAGIFIWEDGQVRGDASPLEFPFRSAQLLGGKPGDGAPAQETTAPSPSAPTAAPRTATRAQIVPIASRRDIVLPGPVATSAIPVEMPALEPEAPPAPVHTPEPAAAPKTAPAARVAPASPPAAAPAPAVKPALPAEKKTEEKPAVKASPISSPVPTAKAPSTPAPVAKTVAPAPTTAPAPAAKIVTPAPSSAPAPLAKTAPPALASAPTPVAKTVATPVPSLKAAAPAPAPALPAKAAAPAPAAAAPVAPPKEVEKEEKEKDATLAAASLLVDEPAGIFSSKLVKLIGAALASILLFVVLFVYPGYLRRSSKPPVVAQDASPLQLRVERTATGLLLTWNQDADAIKTASKGLLSINDGPQHEDVRMDLEQLRTGSIMYTPSTADISFRMEVTGTDPSKVTTASFRALGSRPSPLADQPAQPGANANKPGVIPPNNNQPNAVANNGKPNTPVAEAVAEPPAPEETRPSSAGAPVKPFSAESLSARLRPTRPADIPDAPTVGAGSVAPAAVPGLNLNAVAPPSAVTPPPIPQAASVQAPVQKSPSAGGNLVSAQLKFRKEPEYPKLAKQAGAKGEVELTATIATNGRLKNIKSLKGHPMLVKAAMDAVSQWVYIPTMLNGQPVEAQTEIRLNFVGDR